MSLPTIAHVPLILIRGFGGFDTDDERLVAYQGFNDGTVYPQKRGENYIYEGLILRYLKSQWKYHDATNVVGYYTKPVVGPDEIPNELKSLDPKYFSGRILHRSRHGAPPGHVARRPAPERVGVPLLRLRRPEPQGVSEALVRLIDFVRDLSVVVSGGPKPPVNIIAHSMGGLIVREAVQIAYPAQRRKAASLRGVAR